MSVCVFIIYCDRKPDTHSHLLLDGYVSEDQDFFFPETHLR
jgi:hypothetical protein